MSSLVAMQLDTLPLVVGAAVFSLYAAISTRSRSRKRGNSAKVATSEEPLGVPAPGPLAQPSEEPSPTAASEEPSPEPSPDVEQEAAQEKGSDESGAPTLAPAATATWPSKAPVQQQRQRQWLVVSPAPVAIFVGVVFWTLVVCLRPRSGDIDLMEARAAPPPSGPPALRADPAGLSQEQVESAEGDVPPGYRIDADGVITMTLARQETTIHEVGDVLYHKSAYYGTVYVGSPAMPYKVVFDTGSGHLVLPSTYCHSETCRLHTRYSRKLSTSAKDIDYDGTIVEPGNPRDQIVVNFGTGEITGVFLEEIVCMSEQPAAAPLEGIGADEHGEEGLPPGCMKMRMIAATAMSEDPFKTFKFDGVLGLGLEGLSQTSEFNFINVVGNSVKGWAGAKHPGTFSVFLGGHEEEASEITLGGWADRRVADELAWAPVLEPELGHWMVQISSVYVDNERVSFCDDGSCKAVVDTGTSLLAVPSRAFPELFELLRHPVSEAHDCLGPGPALHFELNGNFTVTMEPRDYARIQELPVSAQVSQVNHRAAFGAEEAEDEEPWSAYCKPLLMSLDLPAPIGPKLFILGEPVLRRYYTVYDAEAKRVGFSLAQHSVAPEPVVNEDNDDWWYEDEEGEE